MLFGHSPSLNRSLPAQSQSLGSSHVARREAEEVPEGAARCWAGMAGPKPAAALDCNWFGWREVLCPGFRSRGFCCQLFTGRTPAFQSARSACCCVDFVSKSTLSSSCQGIALLAQAASTSTGLGLLGK